MRWLISIQRPVPLLFGYPAVDTVAALSCYQVCGYAGLFCGRWCLTLICRIMETGLFPRSGKNNPSVKWQKNAFRFITVFVTALISWGGADDLDKVRLSPFPLLHTTNITIPSLLP